MPQTTLKDFWLLTYVVGAQRPVVVVVVEEVGEVVVMVVDGAEVVKGMDEVVDSTTLVLVDVVTVVDEAIRESLVLLRVEDDVCPRSLDAVSLELL